MDVEGKVAVVTGATGGLGKVVSRAFAEAGSRLALLSTDPVKLAALLGELRLPGEHAMTAAVDLRDGQATRDIIQLVVEKLGPPQILLHLVGGWVGGRDLLAAVDDELDSMLQQHVWTTWHLLRAALPHLVSTGWGRVLVVSSPHATQPGPRNSAYAAAKAAQEVLLLAAAREYGSGNVTANVLQVRTIDVEHKRDTDPSPSNAVWTSPEELVSAMLYLCSEGAQVVNGVRLPVYGGMWPGK